MAWGIDALAEHFRDFDHSSDEPWTGVAYTASLNDVTRRLARISERPSGRGSDADRRLGLRAILQQIEDQTPNSEYVIFTFKARGSVEDQHFILLKQPGGLPPKVLGHYSTEPTTSGPDFARLVGITPYHNTFARIDLNAPEGLPQRLALVVSPRR